MSTIRRRSLRSLPSVLAIATACQGPARQPFPIGHAHNDYLHEHPLTDAFAQGFRSIEVDVFLVDGQLRVGHEREHLLPGTLQSLYLEPLRDLRPRGAGTIYLLVDIKADGPAVYCALRPLLERYRDLLTVFRDGGTTPGAVAVILSGDRPRELVAAERERLCAIDGRPADLDCDPPPALVPWISDAWQNQFGAGTVALDAGQLRRLAGLVARAHAQGRLVRFWGAPDREEVWEEQRAAGVDLLNTDRLAEFAAWAARIPRNP